MGCMWRGTSPLVGWAPPPLWPMRLGFWVNPKGWAPPLPWGARQPPWPPPPPQIGSEGAGPPLPCPYIYVGGGRAAAPKFWRSPPLSQVLLRSRGAWRSPAGLPRSATTTTPSSYCWMESSPTSPSLLAGSRRGRRHRAAHVLNAEAPLFGA